MNEKDKMAKALAKAKAVKKVLPYSSGARNKSMPNNGMVGKPSPFRKNPGR